jgi:hypothetical protein
VAAKKPEPLTVAHLVRGSVRGHAARNERLYVREKTSDPAVRGAIVDELVTLAAATVKHHDAQREKASKPRGVIHGRTMSDLITALARQHPNEEPRESWPHMRSAIEDWVGECTETNENTLRYPYEDGHRTITFKHFSALLRATRKKRP